MRIYKNNIDITELVERIDSDNYSLTYSSGEYIYFATDYPFNNFFVKLGTIKNLVSATMKVEYYSGSWTEVVDLKDGTNAFKKDGHIEFTPNTQVGWANIFDSTTIGLTQIAYYKYWMRISFNVSLTASVDLSFIGYKFSDDVDLYSEYPVFDDANFRNAYKSGKTNWDEQHEKAAKLIISDLQKKNVLIAPEQILDRKKFIYASVSKVAELIFSAFGNDYIEQKKAAREEYYARLNLSQYSLDTNNDGILQRGESEMKQNWMTR